MDEIKIAVESIESEDARILIDELSDILHRMTGNDGRSTFNNADMLDTRSVFVIARNAQGTPVGCGALRRMSADTAEIKRMYARANTSGTGTRLIAFLEQKAHELAFSKVRIQTRVLNENAVRFYKKNGYTVIPNYGIYENRPEAICFQKDI